MDYAKKYDQERREQAVKDYEQKLNNSTYSKDREGANNFFIIIGIAIAAFVITGIVRNIANRPTPEESKASKEKYEDWVNKTKKSMLDFDFPFNPLTKDQVKGMTINEIEKSINKSTHTIENDLVRLGWQCIDYDGYLIKNHMKVYSRATGLERGSDYFAEERNIITKMKRAKKLQNIDPLRIYAIIQSTIPESSIGLCISFFDKNSNLIKNYGVLTNQGIETGGFENFEKCTFYNIESEYDNETLIINPVNFDLEVDCISVYVSTDTANTDLYEVGKRTHKNISIKIFTNGYTEKPIIHNWPVKIKSNKLLNIGYFKKNPDSEKWVFFPLTGKYVNIKLFDFDSEKDDIETKILSPIETAFKESVTNEDNS
jgi:hypothetical protein